MARSRGTNLIAFLAATVLALALASGATAQPREVPVVALAPHGDGVAALRADGTVVHVARGGGSRRLARGLDGEVLVACGERLLAVDASGVLVEIGGPFGPPVSLHATPLCLGDGTGDDGDGDSGNGDDGAVLAIDPDGRRLLRLDARLQVVAAASLSMLPDAQPVLLEDGSVAIPTSPTFRYPHGVLGDAVESAGLAIVDPADLSVLARWETAHDQVIEQRRIAAFPAAGPRGLVATLSGSGDGGALVVLAERDREGAGSDGALAPVARAAGMGSEMRWRHVVGVRGERLYAVATPHIGGPLERWTLDGDAGRLRREAFALGVTSHQIGRRELDLGRLLPRAAGDPDGLDLLVFPDRTLRSLRLIACDGGGCRTTAELPLDARLAAAPWTERDADGGIAVWVADLDGGLQRRTFPRDGIPTNQE